MSASWASRFYLVSGPSVPFVIDFHLSTLRIRATFPLWKDLPLCTTTPLTRRTKNLWLLSLEIYAIRIPYHQIRGSERRACVYLAIFAVAQTCEIDFPRCGPQNLAAVAATLKSSYHDDDCE